MNNKVNSKSEFRCKICNKIYASSSSLCNHNKKFHCKINTIMSTNVSLVSTNVSLVSTNVNQMSTNLYYCSPSPSIIAIHSSIDKPFSNAITNLLYSSLY